MKKSLLLLFFCASNFALADISYHSELDFQTVQEVSKAFTCKDEMNKAFSDSDGLTKIYTDGNAAHYVTHYEFSRYKMATNVPGNEEFPIATKVHEVIIDVTQDFDASTLKWSGKTVCRYQ